MQGKLRENCNHLLSSSTMITVASSGSPTVTLLGNDYWSIVNLKVSFTSNMPSLRIEILSATLIDPEINATSEL